MGVFEIDVGGLTQADRALRKFGATVENWRPFWSQLGESLATETQRRWPLRRRSGRLRESLHWTGSRLGRGGVFESSPDRLTFGSSIFYSRFSQYGTKQQRARPLIHVNEKQHTELLRAWLVARAQPAGVEVET